MAVRARPNVVGTFNSPNRYSPRGATIQAIVVHSTESDNSPGSGDLFAVANWLCRSTTDASANVITDGDGLSVRLVEDGDAAWACATYNRVTLNVEQVGRASQAHWSERELRETARWLAVWSIRHGVPLRHGRASAGRITRTGVLRHSDLGISGGGHVDPGPAYPLGKVLKLAKRFKRQLQKEHT